MANAAINMINANENINKDDQDYLLYLVFELPSANDVASHSGKLITEPEAFLLQCLKNAKQRNEHNLKDGVQHSHDYFTNLNHAERHRIPSTLQRLNPDMETERFGIMSFHVFRDEQVKNKVYNQRVSSVNPQVIDVERIKSIYYPLNYQTERFIDLYPLGKTQLIEQENFCIIDVDESVIQKAKLLG